MVLAGLLTDRIVKTLHYMLSVSLVELDMDTGTSTNCSAYVSSTFQQCYTGLFHSSWMACSEIDVRALG